MKFLEDIDFTIDEISAFESKLSESIAGKIQAFAYLIVKNVKFLKEIGVKNYKELFTTSSETFLKDHSEFKEMFLKYDPEDLIEKLEKNPAIVEYL